MSKKLGLLPDRVIFFVACLLGACLLVACNSKEQSKISETSTSVAISGTDIMQDNALQAVFIADQNQELTDHLSDQNGSIFSFGLTMSPECLTTNACTETETLLPPDPIMIDGAQIPTEIIELDNKLPISKSVSDMSVEKTRNCLADATSNNVVVSISRDFTGETFTKKGNKTRSSSEKIDRVWTHPTVDLACVNDHLDFKGVLNTLVGLSNETTFSKSQTTTPVKESDTRSRTVTKEGKRKVEYLTDLTPMFDIGIIIYNLKINSTTSKSLSISKDGVSTSVSSSVTTKDLLVEVRETSSVVWTEKLVRSGSITSVIENGAKINFSFDNVLFERSETRDSCEPVSGTIAGSIEAAGESRSLKVVFAAGEQTVTVNDQPSTLDFDFGGCDFGKAL